MGSAPSFGDSYTDGQYVESQNNEPILFPNTPAVEIILRFSCNQLANFDSLSKSDPFIVLEELYLNQWREVGRTEVIVDNQNPKFTRSFKYTYKFEVLQKIRISVYDSDENGDTRYLRLENQDFIGSVDGFISEIVSAGSRGKSYRIMKGYQCTGTVTINSEEVSQKNSRITFDLSVHSSVFTDRIFIIISYENQGRQLMNCYRTEIKSISNSCYFRTINIDTTVLCNSDDFCPIIFTVNRYRPDGRHLKMAECRTTLPALLQAVSLPLYGLSGMVGKETGYLNIQNVITRPIWSFLQYINSGCELEFMVGIDFTGSNGDPRLPSSLHYGGQGIMNSYEQMIYAVGSIIEYFDTDKLFPTYLFGGLLNGVVQHCFPLNGCYEEPRIHGVDSILTWYRTALNSVLLYGPTLFTPLLTTAGMIASQYDTSNTLKYLVLLILTDGSMNDTENTINKIIDLCSLPLSIIIVGIGNGDFSLMERLDGDNVRLSIQGRTAPRDIVQFASMSQLRMNPSEVASIVLREVPKQLCDYMLMKGKYPTNQ